VSGWGKLLSRRRLVAPMSRRGSGGLGGYGAFVLLAAALYAVAVAIVRFIWLERADSVGGGSGTIAPAIGGQHYLALFLIALVGVAVLAQFRSVARPVWIGLGVAVLAYIYMYLAARPPTAVDGLLVFLAYWGAGAVAVGLADGLVRGYRLKGV
jgi:hypothetical protein